MVTERNQSTKIIYRWYIYHVGENLVKKIRVVQVLQEMADHNSHHPPTPQKFTYHIPFSPPLLYRVIAVIENVLLSVDPGKQSDNCRQ